MSIAMGIVLVISAGMVFLGAYLAYESYHDYMDYLTQKETTE